MANEDHSYPILTDTKKKLFVAKLLYREHAFAYPNHSLKTPIKQNVNTEL